MLWTKETTNRKQVVFVDIFEICDAISNVLAKFKIEMNLSAFEFKSLKDNETAYVEIFGVKEMLDENQNPEQIMVQINGAICLAEKDQSEGGVAYSQRASCFFRLQKYSLCLADIETAKKNHFPDHAKQELEKFKQKCLRALDLFESEQGDGDQPKLSFPADAKIPCYAQGLEVKQSKKFGRHIVTSPVEIL